jgi:hypothetical protein
LDPEVDSALKQQGVYLFLALPAAPERICGMLMLLCYCCSLMLLCYCCSMCRTVLHQPQVR